MAMETVGEALALGLELHQRGELARAEPIYRQVLTRDPHNVKALNLLAIVAMQSARVGEAVPLLEQAVALDSGGLESTCNLSTAYLKARRLDEALALLDEACRLHPRASGAFYNRAITLQEMDRFDESIADYQRAIELENTHVSALNNLGNLLGKRGRPQEALGYLDRALALNPQHALAHHNKALSLLTLGRLQEGFAEYEWRLKCGPFQTRTFTRPAWDGSPLGDRTLLVYTEQGLGDTFQFVRFLPLAARRAPKLIFGVPPVLVPIIAQSGVRNLLVEGSPLPPHDVQLPLVSLAHVLGTTLETIPADVPYLSASDRLVKQWRTRLAAYDGFKVGIVWQGSTTYQDDRYRSMPLASFAPLAEVPGVRLFSLQKGPGSEQIAALAGAFPIVDLSSQIDVESGAFMDTAAIMKNLDLVVSSDTSCAHLAGGLNVNVWIALAHWADWRWLRDRHDSPWYPSARLFRQPSPGDWAGLFRTMAHQLAQLVPAV